MSDNTQPTPRTNVHEQSIAGPNPWSPYTFGAVPAQFARGLEHELAELQAATGLCEKHQPKGGFRRCLVCGIESLYSAISQIAAQCETPNEMGCTAFDVHCNEDEVVKQVAALRAERDLMRMQAAAVMTASFQNTETSVKDRIRRDNPYWTQCYADMCAAVDREMKLRAERDELRSGYEMMKETAVKYLAERDALVKERDQITTFLTARKEDAFHRADIAFTSGDVSQGDCIRTYGNAFDLTLRRIAEIAARSSGGKGAT